MHGVDLPDDLNSALNQVDTLLEQEETQEILESLNILIKRLETSEGPLARGDEVVDDGVIERSRSEGVSLPQEAMISPPPETARELVSIIKDYISLLLKEDGANGGETVSSMLSKSLEQLNEYVGRAATSLAVSGGKDNVMRWEQHLNTGNWRELIDLDNKFLKLTIQVDSLFQKNNDSMLTLGERLVNLISNAGLLLNPDYNNAKRIQLFNLAKLFTEIFAKDGYQLGLRDQSPSNLKPGEQLPYGAESATRFSLYDVKGNLNEVVFVEVVPRHEYHSPTEPSLRTYSSESEQDLKESLSAKVLEETVDTLKAVANSCEGCRWRWIRLYA